MNVTTGNMIRFAVFLLFSCQIKGSRAVTPVFVQKGNDVLLEVMKDDVPEEFILFVWKFGEDVLVTFTPKSGPTVFERYTGRVEFSVENYSVKLKNLQETDSGVYAARVTAAKEQILSEYKVTVQDPVSLVNLTVDSVSNSSTPCNLTVTCRTQDSDIISTFTCDTQTCRKEGGERSKVTASGASLQVYLDNDAIICNHSNQVSWTKNQEQTKIRDSCPRHDGNKQEANYLIIVGVLMVVLLVVLLTAAVSYLIKKRKRRRMIINLSDTVYADPQVETANQSQTNDASPFTTYCLVGPHTGPMESTETRGRTLPETLYAQVQKPVKS